MLYDILIVGGGPAGLTAATYARRAGKSVLVIEKNAFGGQITWSPRVENFPGFVSITGTELGDFDRISVVQRSNSSTHNALSKSYDRACYALFDANKWKVTDPKLPPA